MFIYKLSYNDILIQNRTIISLVRVNTRNGKLEAIRACSDKIMYSNERAKFINYYAGNCLRVFQEDYTGHCRYDENLLSSARIGDEDTSPMFPIWSRVMGLLEGSYRKTFIGVEIVSDFSQYNGYISCITQPTPAQQAAIDALFHDAAIQLPNSPPVFMTPDGPQDADINSAMALLQIYTPEI